MGTEGMSHPPTAHEKLEMCIRNSKTGARKGIKRLHAQWETKYARVCV